MGAVYAVARADGAFEQRAALKLLRASADDPAPARASCASARSSPASSTRPSPACSTAASRTTAAPGSRSSGSTARPSPPSATRRRASGRAARCGSSSRCSPRSTTRTATWSSTATSSRRTSWSPRRASAEAARLRHRQAARRGRAAAEHTGTLLGAPLTPQYAAPEQVHRRRRHHRHRRLRPGRRALRAALPAFAPTASRATRRSRSSAPSSRPSRGRRRSAAAGSVGRRRRAAPTPARLARRLRAISTPSSPRRSRRSPASATPRPPRSPATSRTTSRGGRSRRARRVASPGGRASSCAATGWASPRRSALRSRCSPGSGARLALVQSRARLAEARRAEAIQHFLLELFAEIDPEQARGREVPLREVVDRGAARLATELRNQPRARAELLLTLGIALPQAGALPARRRSCSRRRSRSASASTGRRAPEVGARPASRWATSTTGATTIPWRSPASSAALAIFRAAGPAPRRAGDGAASTSAHAAPARPLRRGDRRLHRGARARARGPRRSQPGIGGRARRSRLHPALRRARHRGAPPRRGGARHPPHAAAGRPPADSRRARGLGLILSALGRSERHASSSRPPRVRTRVFGPDHPAVLEAMNSLASRLRAAGRWSEARAVRDGGEPARRRYAAPAAPRCRPRQQPGRS